MSESQAERDVVARAIAAWTKAELGDSKIVYRKDAPTRTDPPREDAT